MRLCLAGSSSQLSQFWFQLQEPIWAKRLCCITLLPSRTHFSGPAQRNEQMAGCLRIPIHSKTQIATGFYIWLRTALSKNKQEKNPNGASSHTTNHQLARSLGLSFRPIKSAITVRPMASHPSWSKFSSRPDAPLATTKLAIKLDSAPAIDCTD